MRRPVAVACRATQICALLLTMAAALAPRAAAQSSVGVDTPYPQLPAVLPARADQFVDSVGVNVHLGYADTAYANYGAVRQRLLDLGVHAIRDQACVTCATQQDRLLDLAGAGIRSDLIMGRPGGPDPLPGLVDLVAGRLRPALLGVEGPNEFDRSGAPGWAVRLRAYQQELYTRVRRVRSLDRVEVLGPSLTRPSSYAALGDMSAWLDCTSIHPYTGGGEPTDGLGDELALAHVTAADKPACATEVGWHDAMAATGGHLPTSDAAAAVYVPRLYLDFFRARIPRTFLYELVDERPDPSGASAEEHFGLLRNDLTPKPAFASLRRLLQLVRPTAQAKPALLRFMVSGGGSDLEQLLLQQDATHQVLILWRDVSVWDRYDREDIPVDPEPVTVQFGQRVDQVDVSTVAPAPPATQTIEAPRQVQLQLGADPVVLTLTRPSP